MKIFSNVCPQSTDRVAQIIGKEDQCIECLVDVIELMKETPIKGQIHNYDPYNYDDVYADVSDSYSSQFKRIINKLSLISRNMVVMGQDRVMDSEMGALEAEIVLKTNEGVVEDTTEEITTAETIWTVGMEDLNRTEILLTR